MSAELESERERSPIAPDVELAIAAAQEQKKITSLDAGSVALAERYANLIDHASARQTYAKAMRLVSAAVEMQADHLTPPNAAALMEAWERLVSALAEHTVASDLGPKLLAALTALGLTPAARLQKVAGGAGGGQVLPANTNPLTLIQGEADGRYGRNAG